MDTLDTGEAERQATAARARDLQARINMVVEILKHFADEDRTRILGDALNDLRSALRVQ